MPTGGTPVGGSPLPQENKNAARARPLGTKLLI